MQTTKGVSSTINSASTHKIIKIQSPSVPTSRPNTQNVSMTNKAQFLNFSQSGQQLFTVQPSGLSFIPVQTSNGTQFIQVQVPNIQQSGANFVQLQTNSQNQSSNPKVLSTNQTFIPVQRVASSGQTNSNKNVSIQLVQTGSAGATSLVGTKTVGQPTQNELTSNDNVQPQLVNTNPVSSISVTNTTSTIFYALQQQAGQWESFQII